MTFFIFFTQHTSNSAFEVSKVDYLMPNVFIFTLNEKWGRRGTISIKWSLSSNGIGFGLDWSFQTKAMHLHPQSTKQVQKQDEQSRKLWNFAPWFHDELTKVTHPSSTYYKIHQLYHMQDEDELSWKSETPKSQSSRVHKCSIMEKSKYRPRYTQFHDAVKYPAW